MGGVLLHFSLLHFHFYFIMFELKIFESEQFGLIRTMVDDKTQEVVFNGNDVASALGYTNPQKALRTHCKGVNEMVTPSPGGPQKMKYLTEPDLYRLIRPSSRRHCTSCSVHSIRKMRLSLPTSPR